MQHKGNRMLYLLSKIKHQKHYKDANWCLKLKNKNKGNLLCLSEDINKAQNDIGDGVLV